MPLLDAIDSVVTFIHVFAAVYVLAIIAYVITSWVRLPYSLNPLQRFLHDVCEPYLRVWRRILPPLGPLDLSPVLAVIVLFAIQRGLDALFARLH